MNYFVRCLEAAEKAARTAETELLRRQTELDRRQQDQKYAHELQQEIHRDAAAKHEGLCCPTSLHHHDNSSYGACLWTPLQYVLTYAQLLVQTHRGGEQTEETACGISDAVRWDQRGEFNAHLCSFSVCCASTQNMLNFRRWRVQRNSETILWSNRSIKNLNWRRRSRGDSWNWTNWDSSCRSWKHEWPRNRKSLKSETRWQEEK